MDIVDLGTVKGLARETGGARVSIYLPTHHFGPGSQEADTTLLRNLIRSAEELLVERGMRGADAEALLKPVRSLIDVRPFWLRSSDGLALLAGPDGLRSFQVPWPFPEFVWVGGRFYLKPLLAMLGSERPLWVLALSQKHVRLLKGTMYGLDEVPVEGIPDSLAEALRWDDYEKSSLQFHTQTPGAGGRRPAIFHGTGETDPKDEIVRYFRGIDHGLRELLRDSTAPLVLAGVEYLLPLYREVNTYPHLADDGVAGSPDKMSDAALHEGAWAIAARSLGARRDAAARRLHDNWASPLATPDLETIVAAAHGGRVDTLFVAVDAQSWGAYDPASGTVTVRDHPTNGDEDLLDLASLQTLLSGGEIYAVPAEQVPRGRPAVALLRY